MKGQARKKKSQKENYKNTGATGEEAVGEQKQQKYGEDLGDYWPLTTLQLFL